MDHHRLSLATSLLVSLTAATACSSGDDETSSDSQASGGSASTTADAGPTADAGETPAVTACQPDASGPIPTRDGAGDWIRFDIEGAVCSDGSTYPIFVNYSNTSNNLMVALEPGGACWDYASCSPDGGLRGAANPNGIADGVTHMTGRFGFLPLYRKDLDDNPLKDWNMIFVPYCTGDLHTGNATKTYTGPNGEELVYQHHGHENVQRVIAWIADHFDDIPQLMVTGCSAGGAGSLLNYHFIRQGLEDAVQCSYLLDDSGPIFPSSGNSGPIHAKVREAWNVDPILDSLEGQFEGVTVDDVKADFGVINTALADKYPQDRLAITLYRWDLNYSIYSYESFYDFPPYTEIHQMWEEDLSLLRELYDTRDNLAYYMPFFRIDNCSHCVTIPPIGLDGSDLNKALNEPWLDSDLTSDADGHWTLQQYAAHVLDDGTPLMSLVEGEVSGEGFTQGEADVCYGL